jgi:hypothetical protein
MPTPPIVLNASAVASRRQAIGESMTSGTVE